MKLKAGGGSEKRKSRQGAPQQIYGDLNTEGSAQWCLRLQDWDSPRHLRLQETPNLDNRIEPRMSILILPWRCFLLCALVANFSLKLPNLQNRDNLMHCIDCFQPIDVKC